MKKEKYFTFENINNISRKMKEKFYLKKQNIEFTPQKSLLLIIDMQRFFLEPDSHAFVPSAEAIIFNIKKLLKLYISNNLTIVATQHSNNLSNSNLMLRWWGDILTDDNPFSQILPDFIHPDVYILKKTQYNAFYNTELEDYLKNKNISQIVITGVMTHLCCETTAREAFVRGFETFFLIDSTATYNENFHNATLLNLSHGFAQTVLCEDIIKKLNKIS